MGISIPVSTKRSRLTKPARRHAYLQDQQFRQSVVNFLRAFDLCAGVRKSQKQPPQLTPQVIVTRVGSLGRVFE